MTFIHGYLLGGLVLVGLPILIHLIMRQKPRRLQFPAFRFLRQQLRINQRRLRFQHLLLLLLRMSLIVALCLALARPRWRTSSLSLGPEQAVAAVFVFDTSLSMGLLVGNENRLKEAQDRALKLMEELGDNSQLALIDSGDEAASGEGIDELTQNLSLVRTRLESLRLRTAAGALNRSVARAAALLQRAAKAEDALPRFLYVFSDRTRASWEAGPTREPLPLDGINVVYVDVGKDGTRDLAIDDIKIDPPVVAPGAPMTIHAVVRATGADLANNITCQIDDDPEVGRVDPQEVRRKAGQSAEVVFKRNAPPAAVTGGDTAYQVRIKLVNKDSLPFNDERCATFIVRPKPRILTLTDDPRNARSWKAVIQVLDAFDVTVKRPNDFKEADLAGVRGICLFQINHPSSELWKLLDGFVRAGGGLAVVPGREQMDTEAYSGEDATKILPARYLEYIKVPADKPHILWAPLEGQDELTGPIRDIVRTQNPDFAHEELRPFVNVYWRTAPATFAVANFEDAQKNPALLVRSVGSGRVVQFANALESDPPESSRTRDYRPAHNYWSDSSFGLVLVDHVCKFLAGTTTAPEVNFRSGQPSALALLGSPPAPPLKLLGPEPSAAQAQIVFADGRLSVTGADDPGNYRIRDSKGAIVAAFSVAPRAEESNLDRVPIEELQATLGKDAVLSTDRSVNLRDLLQTRWPAPFEFMPWLMLMLLMAMTFEGVLSNKFYRRTAPDSAAAS
jgi:hypothetical protein